MKPALHEVKNVSGCVDCHFAQSHCDGDPHRCKFPGLGLRPELDEDVEDYALELKDGPKFPDWCPLLRSDVIITVHHEEAS
jgi:hypothetical protein